MAITTVSSHVVSVNAIQGTLIADNAITAVHIATNAVSGTLIADNAVTATHIAQNTITVTQIADDAIEAAKIADGVITTNHLNKAMISSQTEVTPVAGDFVLLGDTSDSNNLKKAPLTLLLNSNVDITGKANLAGSNTTAAAFTSGTGNVVASFTSSDTIGAIQLADNGGNVELSAVGNDFHVMNAGGTAKMVVLNSGNVGIGTTTPDHLLEVETDSSSVAPKIGFRNTQAGAQIGMPADTNALYFVTGDSERMRINSDGYVSLNRDANEYGLELKSAGTRSGIVLKKPGTDTIQGSVLMLADESFRLGTASVYNIQMYQNGNVVMPNGSVGVGESSPGFKLTIGGGIGANQSTAYASMTGQLGFGNDYSDTQRGPNKIVLQNDGTWIAGLGISNGSTDLYSGGHFTFRTGTSLGTERMRITSTGHVAIAATARFYLDVNSIGNGDTYIDEYAANEVGITTGGSRKLAVSGGNLYVSGSVNANHNFSDERLKENIVVIPNALEKVSSLRGITFKRKDNGNVGTGLIAQELEKVLPEAVYKSKKVDSLENPDAEEWKAINYGNTVGLLVEAIKELKAEIEELKNK